MTQTSFSRDMTAAYAGQVAHVLEPEMTVSPIAQGTIPAGRWVGRDSADADNEGSLPDAAAEITATGFGVSVYDAKKEDGSSYAQYESVLALKRGTIWVLAEDAVAHGGAVYARHTAGASLTDLGRFRSDDGDEGGGALAALVPSARWESSATAGNLAKMSINLP